MLAISPWWPGGGGAGSPPRPPSEQALKEIWSPYWEGWEQFPAMRVTDPELTTPLWEYLVEGELQHVGQLSA